MDNQETAENVRAVILLLEDLYEEGSLTEDERDLVGGFHELLREFEVFERAGEERRREIAQSVSEEAPDNASMDYLLGRAHSEDESITEEYFD